MARRVLALVCLGVALIVCVALAASESLANRTGRTATAVTVTFSEEVRITSYDESVFPTKEPSNRSETFRFSGGQLENGARFSISWTPSTAQITNTEWETTGAASSGSTASSTPPTYEEIMAQIAQYPGPDEPLCVPAEGEQIWLTDLAGHADIYDNDSIKINYAPGFDKSQITKIEVYRNGVKLAFVPPLFDVLTNDQMKTFDGNYTILDWSEGVHEQDSPKSSHTDHAIMGYEYSLIFCTASSAVANVLAARIESGVKWHPKWVYACIYSNPAHFIDYFNLTPAQILAYMQKLRDAGFDGVTLEWNMFVDSLNANEVVTQPSKPEYLADMWSPLITWPMDKFELMVASAKQAGLAVELKGHAFVSRKWEQANPGVWTYSAFIEPRNVTAFLDSVFASMKPALEICQRYGVERADVLTEMQGLERHTSEIKAFLDKVAQVFSGELGIDSSTYSNANWRWNEEARFWDWTDGTRHLSAGESCYGEFSQTQNDPRLSSMISNFTAYWAPALSHFRSTYPESDFFWGELGTWPVDGVARGGDYMWNLDMAKDARNDIQEFNDSFAAFLLGSKALGVDGACVFFASICDVEPLNIYKSSIFTNSSTMALISSIIGP